MKKCPYCAEEIQEEAILCRYCGKELNVPPPINNISPTNAIDPPKEGQQTAHPIEVNISLSKGEFCYISEKVDLYEEKTLTKRVSFHGPTIRLKILPGVYYRAGNFGVGKKTEIEFVKIDTGILYVTSERLIFIGSMNNKSITYNKIVNFHMHDKGIEIIKGSGNNQYFFMNNNLLYTAQLVQHFIKNR